ncbi:MAG: hypothetical protein KBF88_11470 [Polyangiaceae bacterium]|nr:hypothetical protein [Polyangiaceae bacterium]
MSFRAVVSSIAFLAACERVVQLGAGDATGADTGIRDAQEETTPPAPLVATLGFDAQGTSPNALPCLRGSSPLDLLQRDPACITNRAPQGFVLSADTFEITLSADSPVLIPGGATPIHWRMRNRTEKTQRLVFALEQAGGTGTRADWALLSGVKIDASIQSPNHTLHFRTSTLDRSGRETNQLGTLPSGFAEKKYLVIDLLPGAVLSKTIEWIGIGIPKAPPPVVLDSGRVIPIKTNPSPLHEGIYIVHVDAPLLGALDRTARLTIEIKKRRTDDPSFRLPE